MTNSGCCRLVQVCFVKCTTAQIRAFEFLSSSFYCYYELLSVIMMIALVVLYLRLGVFELFIIAFCQLRHVTEADQQFWSNWYH